MSQIAQLVQVFFDLRCADCGAISRRFLCRQCARLLELSRDVGSAVYLFEESSAATALCSSKKKKARDLLVSFIHVRLDLLGWNVGIVMAKEKQLAYVARQLQKDLEGKDLLVMDLDPRLCLTQIEL